MEQLDHANITKKSDYIRFLTSVTVILQHIKIVTIQWKKGLVLMKTCDDMSQGVYFEN